MKLAIKNMVCSRCILVISLELKKVRLKATAISLGEVELAKEPTPNQLEKFRSNIAALGFELLDDNKKQLTEKIKNIIITEVHHSRNVSKSTFHKSFLSR